MPEGKAEYLNIEILGKLDPSLMATINTVKAKLKELGADSRTSNEVLKRAYAQLFEGTSRSAAKFGSETKSTFSRVAEAGVTAARRISHAFEHTFGELGMEVVKGFGFAGGFGIAQLAAGGIENLKEFGRRAIETRGEREVLQTQLRTITESQRHATLAADIDTMIRNIEGREVPEKYIDLMKSTTQLLSSAPKLFGSVESVHKMLGQIADVSRDPQAFSLATQAFTRMLAQGKVDAAHLRELAIDTGYNFRQAMADALKLTPAQLAEQLKKGKLSGEKSIEALFKAFTIITGPGGPAYKHAEAQLEGWKGLAARWQGHVEDFQESFGKQLENFFAPIMSKIFEFLTPAALTHAFDTFESLAKGWGQSVAYLIDALVKGDPAKKFAELGTEMHRFFSAIFGLPAAPMFKEITGGISGIGTQTILSPEWKTKLDDWSRGIAEATEKIRSTIEFMRKNWNTILNGMKFAAGLWAADKVNSIFNTVRDFLKNVGLMNVEAGVVNVVGGAGTAGIAAEIEGGALAAGRDAIGLVVAKKILDGIKIALAGPALSSGVLEGALTPLKANIIAAMILISAEIARQVYEYSMSHAKEIIDERAAHAKAVPGGTALDLSRKGFPASKEEDELIRKRTMRMLEERTRTRAYTPAEAYSTPETLSRAREMRDSINQAASDISSIPEKTSSISNSFDSSASIASSWPSKASSISSALDSLVSAINNAASSAVSSINAASANAAAMLV